jgi:uncharacterized protein (DUF1330 family)
MTNEPSPIYVFACANPADADWLGDLDAAAVGGGGARLALAPPSAISIFEGDWPGGAAGLWRFENSAFARKAVLAVGAPKPGDFALCIPERPDAPPPSAGFMIVQGLFTDPAKAAAYGQALPPIYVQYEGSYLALSRPDAIAVLAGDWAPRAVVIATFRSATGAETFWRSPEYAAAKKLRAGGGHFLVIAFPAC